MKLQNNTSQNLVWLFNIQFDILIKNPFTKKYLHILNGLFKFNNFIDCVIRNLFKLIVNNNNLIHKYNENLRKQLPYLCISCNKSLNINPIHHYLNNQCITFNINDNLQNYNNLDIQIKKYDTIYLNQINKRLNILNNILQEIQSKGHRL